ncbi:MAG TPA: hypothetical protein VJB14_10105 [Planctomycetota bacterium]|nr:hypothetical protein [Planctomycetota bacterium]
MFTASALAALSLLAAVQNPPPPDSIQKERATLLRSALKPYGAFQGVDRDGRLLLRAEGEKEDKAWTVDPDAEIRLRGTWGAIEDLVPGERLWVWIRLDRESKPRAVFMITDEISEQDIHQVLYTLVSADAVEKSVVVRRKLDGKKEQTRTLKVHPSAALSREGDDFVFRSASPETVARARPEASVYVQTANEEIVRLVDVEGLAKLKEAQKARVEERWRKIGLPGTLVGLHLLSGEIDLAMDHEAMRWARSLKSGDLVTLKLAKPVQAMVQEVRPWYERTRLTLVCAGRNLADVAAGHRIRLGITEPAAEALASRLPTDSGRPREAAARAEWMLASTYCACSIAGDGCTGMYYTLAACNGMTCGMPNRVRKFVKPLIEKGDSDREVFERMETEFGLSIWKPHLLR